MYDLRRLTDSRNAYPLPHPSTEHAHFGNNRLGLVMIFGLENVIKITREKKAQLIAN